jgi:hypothetical protein
MAARHRGLTVAFAGIALLLAATHLAYRPIVPLGVDAPPTVFSAQRAAAILRDLVGDGVPHPIGSSADARLREAIVERLSALGYRSELQSGWVCDEGACGNPVNIIARLGSDSEDRSTILLAGHYDSVPAGPGASDDGAAAASMLEIARILLALPAPRHPIVLLFTDGEEAGLLGASLFVREHPLSHHVKAAVNMEARGTSGPSLMFETGAANTWLMHLYQSAIARPLTNSLFYVVYKRLPNDTDFTVFKAAGYQGFNFAYIGNVGRYHTPLDNAANADASSIQHQGDNALAALWALANSPTWDPSTGESVFFDGFSRTLIAWPAAFTVPAALLALILLLAESAVLLRKGAVTWRQALWGWAATGGTLGVGVALCSGLLALAIGLHKVPPLESSSWISQPLPMHITAAAIALLAAAGAGLCLARRAHFWGFWMAAALQIAVLCVISAVVVPGASFPFLLTAAAAAVGALPCTVSLLKSETPKGWASDLAALLPALVLFGAEFPLLQFLYMALGSPAWPLSTLVLCLGTASLLPLLARAGGTARRIVVALAALTALGGAMAALGMPAYSADWPERVNLEYWLDVDTGESHYLARCDSLRLPATLAAAAHFEPISRPRFAGSASQAFYADAPLVALAPPELSAAETTGTAAARYVLHLRSARGAPEAIVVFPAAAQVGEIELAAAQGPVRAKSRKLRSGATLLDIVGLPAAGVDFSFDAAGVAPIKVQVFDQSYDFPQQGDLQHARGPNTTSSQDGDLTVVHRTVSLYPAAGR